MFADYDQKATLFERLADRAEKRCGHMCDLIEAFSSNKLRVDMMEALVSGLLIGFLLCTTDSDGSRHLIYCIEDILIALSSYTAVALLLYRFWHGNLRRMVPSWMLIATGGTLLCLVITFTPAIVNGWDGAPYVKPTLSEYTYERAKEIRSFFVLFTLLTLPITAVIHYADSVIRGMRR